MKKKSFQKFLVSFLIFTIVITSFSSFGYASNSHSTKLDVLSGDFNLVVEGKRISHKEIFMYKGDLWVPLSDLSNGLGIKTKFNSKRNTLYVNSMGKLNISDKDLENKVYQSGYEILAKEKNIKSLQEEIRKYNSNRNIKDSKNQLDTKTISALITHGNVVVDNKDLSINREIIQYNGDNYLSITGLSSILYITPSLVGNTIQIDTNAILKEKPGFNSIEQLAAFRGNINERLDIELKRLEKEKETIMGVKIPYEKIDSIKDMEKYLNKHLGRLEDIPVDISLSQGNNSNWYKIEVDVDNRYYREWRNLSRSDIQSYVSSIFTAIRTLLDQNANIEGYIRDSRYSNSRYRNYVDFTTESNRLKFSFIDSGLDLRDKVDPNYIKELLEKNLSRFRRCDFNYEVSLSGYDLNVNVFPRDNCYMRRWSLEDRMHFIDEIGYIINREYPNTNIIGKIIYGDYEDIDFNIEDGQILSSSIIVEMMEHLNDRYSIFRASFGNIDINHSITAKDNRNYELNMYMDFSNLKDPLNTEDLNKLSNMVIRIIEDIYSIWDVNIIANVYDRDGSKILEEYISKDFVSPITANPIQGEIVEGTKVELSTATTGAKIYYTIDGTTPKENDSYLYKGPITITKDTTVSAFATKEKMNNSTVYNFKYKVVKSGDISKGLESLEVRGYRLGFDKDKYDYNLKLDNNTRSLDIKTEFSSGITSLKYNGSEQKLSNNEYTSIDLVSGKNNITIVQLDQGKKPREYKINLNSDSTPIEGNFKLSNVKLYADPLIKDFSATLINEDDSNYDFSNSKGTIAIDFSGQATKELIIDKNGRISASNFDYNFLVALKGYRVIIKDDTKIIIDEVLHPQK